MSEQANTSSEEKSAVEESAVKDTSSSAEKSDKPVTHVPADVYTPARPIFAGDFEE